MTRDIRLIYLMRFQAIISVSCPSDEVVVAMVVSAVVVASNVMAMEVTMEEMAVAGSFVVHHHVYRNLIKKLMLFEI